MNEAENGPLLYRVSYTVRVQKHLLTLGKIAQERGDLDNFVASLKEFHRRLCLYPQFGEQVHDLNQMRGQVWVGFVHPLSIRYGVLEDERLVTVANLPVLLKKAPPESHE